MSTSTESQTRRERTWIYYTALVILGVMVLGALLVFRGARESRQASEKADQLIAALEDAGATAPEKEQIVRVLGDDGGPRA